MEDVVAEKERVLQAVVRTRSGHLAPEPFLLLSADDDEPLSSSEALEQLSGILTVYEISEVALYEVIYYAGQQCKAKVRAPSFGRNSGYDSDSGAYRIRMNDHLAYRYEIISMLGTGAFGQVVQAVDHATDAMVAVKIIHNKRKSTAQARTEIEILQHIKEKDHHDRYGLVRMLDNFVFREHVCITYELLDISLYEHMKITNFFPMTLNSVKRIAARVLVSLAFLWKEDIIHCDLKPENILFKSLQDSGTVKVVDLGSACFSDSVGFTYIQSRFYRAPEVILGDPYGKPIDLWSFACILCELASGYPLFPGRDERDQLSYIVEYLGLPSHAYIDASKRRSVFFDDDRNIRRDHSVRTEELEPGSRKLSTFLGISDDHEFVDFLNQFLKWDAGERVSPREAMKHSWVVEEFVFKAPASDNNGKKKDTASSKPRRPAVAAQEKALPPISGNSDGGTARGSIVQRRIAELEGNAATTATVPTTTTTTQQRRYTRSVAEVPTNNTNTNTNTTINNNMRAKEHAVVGPGEKRRAGDDETKENAPERALPRQQTAGYLAAKASGSPPIVPRQPPPPPPPAGDGDGDGDDDNAKAKALTTSRWAQAVNTAPTARRHSKRKSVISPPTTTTIESTLPSIKKRESIN